MSNYNQLNIYRKQMIKLGLNTQQYAQLINMPYEVVKDIIYDKEGDYSMDIKNILRKNVFQKHEEIENDLDNAKLKALNIKKEDIDYLDWYNNVYSKDVLFEKCNINSIRDFERNYYIELRNKKASRWYYSCIIGKIEYANHNIKESEKVKFLKQLYDIYENNNKDKYVINTSDEIMEFFINNDIEKILKKHNMTQLDLARKVKISPSTLSAIISRKGKYERTTITMKKIYNYLNDNKLINDIRQAQINGENEIIENVKDTFKDEPLEIKVATTTEKPFIIDMKEKQIKEPVNIYNENVQDEILRKLLINRLTEEEKELIRIFGGKVE